MISPNGNGGATLAPFTQRDADMVLSILDNQPLQNMKVAREVQALQMRFAAFCAAHLPNSKRDPDAFAQGKKKGAKPAAGDVNPAS